MLQNGGLYLCVLTHSLTLSLDLSLRLACTQLSLKKPFTYHKIKPVEIFFRSVFFCWAARIFCFFLPRWCPACIVCVCVCARNCYRNVHDSVSMCLCRFSLDLLVRVRFCFRWYCVSYSSRVFAAPYTHTLCANHWYNLVFGVRIRERVRVRSDKRQFSLYHQWILLCLCNHHHELSLSWVWVWFELDLNNAPYFVR